MNQKKIHSKGNVPFSWENKPGVSKVSTNHEHPVDEEKLMMINLPPPPFAVESPRVSAYDIQIPLPPCTFQTPTRSCSRKGLKHKQDDPFFAAYKECTRTTAKRSSGKFSKDVAGLKKGLFNFSCKQSCSVRDDNFVRVSQLPCERS